ncbi:hypothetical protein ES815_23265 [Leclercia adecarboxylata]|uniref:Uncharacterized protein n=1 Tax=Leclercia adecarboxylata TaxID=83655 RepID=A0AAP9DE44_9ENTR|nr:hypothetical protein ES815_23265 [Leclercia adecarboxylata]
MQGLQGQRQGVGRVRRSRHPAMWPRCGLLPGGATLAGPTRSKAERRPGKAQPPPGDVAPVRPAARRRYACRAYKFKGRT